MTGRYGNDSSDPLAALNLPQSINTQALKLLGAIEQARTKTEAWRAADRAEGFGLGIETLRALNPGDNERLYMAFEDALQTRLAELEK
jgi:hypothetical protein